MSQHMKNNKDQEVEMGVEPAGEHADDRAEAIDAGIHGR